MNRGLTKRLKAAKMLVEDLTVEKRGIVRAADLQIGMLVDVSNDSFFNAVNRDGPRSREVLRFKPTVKELVYVYYSGDVCITYPDDYEVEVYYAADEREPEIV